MMEYSATCGAIRMRVVFSSGSTRNQFKAI